MNKCYQNDDSFISNRRIIESYFAESKIYAKPSRKSNFSVVSFLLLVVRCLLSEKVIRIAKTSGVALSLVGFIGIIGAMEYGTLELGTGVMIGLVLLGVEYLCLRSRKAHHP